MKVLIIEDECPAAQKLIRRLKAIDPAIDVVEILRSVEQSINWLHQHTHPELIFMDVQLNDGICFDIFENVELKVPIIFTTAFDKYSLKAFKVNSVDYLLKPIDQEELKKALDKYSCFHQSQPTFNNIEALFEQLKPKTKERFLVKVGEHFKSIPTSRIFGFIIRDRYSYISTDEGKEYIIDYSLDKIEKIIDDQAFFRINRNCIINYYAIKDVLAYSSSRLKVMNKLEEELLVSRERVVEFKAWMDR